MEHLINFASDMGDLSQMNPEAIMKLTDQVSSSMLDVSNLTKSAHISLSTPSLVAGRVWSKLTKKKAKLPNSKTHLLSSTGGLDNYVDTTDVSDWCECSWYFGGGFTDLNLGN